MAGNITLDNLVSVSELSHGGVSKTGLRVKKCVRNRGFSRIDL